VLRRSAAPSSLLVAGLRDGHLALVSGIAPVRRIEQVGPKPGANADIELSVLSALRVLTSCFLVVVFGLPSRKTLAQLLEHAAMMVPCEGAGKRTACVDLCRLAAGAGDVLLEEDGAEGFEAGGCVDEDVEDRFAVGDREADSFVAFGVGDEEERRGCRLRGGG
jgi:hypothetical protein